MSVKLEAMKERLERASPGPWRLEQNHEGRGQSSDLLPFRIIEEKVTEGVNGCKYGENNHIYIAEATGYGQQQNKNAEFIAHSRTDMEQLIRIVEIQQLALNDPENHWHASNPEPNEEARCTACRALADTRKILEGK